MSNHFTAVAGDMTLANLNRMMECVSPGIAEREWRGSSATIGELVRCLKTGTGEEMVAVSQVYGFPVYEDERCPKGMLFFGPREEFERMVAEAVRKAMPPCEGAS